MESITPLTRMQPSPDVLFSQVGDEAVLLNLTSGVYYSLDHVGTMVWSGLAGGKALGDIQQALHQHFDVGVEVIWADLTALVVDLQASNLVTVSVKDS